MKQDQENAKNLRKTIEELQSFDSDLNLWNRIHDRLDYEEKVTKLIPFLPEHDCRKNLWEQIENKLNLEISRKRKKVISIISYSTAVAASVVLVISIEFLTPEPVSNQNSKNVTISYSQEVIGKDQEIVIKKGVTKKDKKVTVVTDKAETEAISFINTTCQVSSHVCETPEFKELKSQLIELESQMGMLDEALKYGEDPELIKTKIKIENLKTRITKELIQKLNS
jgi:hypothetical protein